MPTDDDFQTSNPTWNPPSPDPDPILEGSHLQDRLNAETQAVLEHANRGWSLVVVAPKWWGLSDGVERLAGVVLFVLILGSGVSQVLWAKDGELGVALLIGIFTAVATFVGLWALQVMLQRRVYGRRRSKAERERAAREKVLKRWQGRANG
jgi:hypothetical protein